MPDLKVTVIQTNPVWENIAASLEAIDAKIAHLEANTDLICLPEMFATGFSMNVRALAQEMASPLIQWLQKKAREKKADIAGSGLVVESGKYYNRLLWVKPNGLILTYDKRHLFRIYGEDREFTPGNEKLIVALAGWKIAPFICYDLRFPVWTRNFHNQYDLAIFFANWPASRSHHWKSLLVARAIENQAYVIGVNRIGMDGNGVAYSGDSAVIDPKGKILLGNVKTECIQTVSLSLDDVNEYRRRFPAWLDADEFEIKTKNG